DRRRVERPRDVRLAALAGHAPCQQRDAGESDEWRIQMTFPAVHGEPGSVILREVGRKGFILRLFDTSQTTLLRVAAFLVDALTLALVLMLPSSLVSYALAWIGGSVKAISIVWAVAV